MTQCDYYQNGERVVSWEWTHDNRGGVVEQAMTFFAPGEETPAQTAVTKNELDENGWETSSTIESMGATTTATYEYEGEPHDGLYDAFYMMSSMGGSTTTTEGSFTWHGSSALKTQTITTAAIATDNAYDEDGYLVSSATKPLGGSGAIPTKNELSYEIDASGAIVSITSTGGPEGTSESVTYTCECDENGNVVKVMNQDGATVATYSWEKVDDPYPRARAMAHANVAVNL